MKAKAKKFILPATATMVALAPLSCNKDDSSTDIDLLIGEWELTQADGTLGDLLDDMQEENYELHIEFHPNGDWEFCYQDNEYKYCYIGDWEYINSDKTEIDFVNDQFSGNLTIQSLKKDKMTGELSFDFDGDYDYSGDVVLEKVY